MPTLLVYMDGTLCGELTQSNSGDLRFRYDDAYRSDSEATPLSLSMPLALSEHRKRVVQPFLEGLLTDNPTAREAVGRRFGVSPRNPFALLSHIGADVAGALQILPPGEESSDASSPRGRMTVLTESEVAERLLWVIDEFQVGSAVGSLGRFSLAGAQPKLALCQTPEEQWALPQGSTPTTHILKPTAGRFSRLDLVEHMTMRAAAILGLNVAQTSLTRFGDLRVMVARRYDRAQVGHQLVRLHQEDCGQALSIPPSKKYQYQDGGPGVADLGRLFSGLPLLEDREPAAWAFWQGLAFNTVLHCTDAHIKNYSVMLSKRTVRLAPLYDLATYAPYDDDGSQTYSAMRIGEHYRFASISDHDYALAAQHIGIEPDRALDFVNTIRHNAAEVFAGARDEVASIDNETADEATNVLNAVARLPSLR